MNDEDSMSDGEAFYRMHREIMKLENEKRSLSAEISNSRRVIENWMSDKIGNENLKKLRMHHSFPYISPVDVEFALSEVPNV